MLDKDIRMELDEVKEAIKDIKLNIVMLGLDLLKTIEDIRRLKKIKQDKLILINRKRFSIFFPPPPDDKRR